MKHRNAGGWAKDMKLKKLKAAREKWLEGQSRPQEKLQLIATSSCLAPSSHDSEGEDQGGLDAQE